MRRFLRGFAAVLFHNCFIKKSEWEMTTFKAVTSELKDTGINEMLKSGIDPLC
ncbi:MAG: hypothetical protein KBT67_06510 [bacterium]|nr:hypothetical protein [Candidatus Limimorpha caballi]